MGKRRCGASFAGVVLILLLGACSDEQLPTVPEPSALVLEGARSLATDPALVSLARQPELIEAMAREEVAAATAGRIGRGIEDDILRLQDQVAGIGGLFYDPDRRSMTVLVAGDGQRDQAAAAVRSLLPASQLDGLVGMEDVQVIVETATYPFSYLVAWRHLLLSAAVNLDGFYSIDADERTNRVVVGVADVATVEAVEQIREELGLPQDGVSVRIETPVTGSASLRDRFRPTGGGIQVQNTTSANCSHGWTVTTSLGDLGFLTAGHCVSGNITAGNLGENFYQAVTGGSNLVGPVTLNQPWNLSGCWDPGPPPVPWTGACTKADVMFVKSGTAAKKVAHTPGPSINNAPGTLTFHGWWTSIGGISPSFVGLGVDKVGRTTGWTRGAITATCKDIKLSVGSVVYIVTCAGEVGGASVGLGDSGGPVFAQATSYTHTLRPLGILFGGTNGNGTCTSSCRYFFNNWQQMNYHLQTYFDPN